MNAHSLLSELTARGATVSANGDRLRLQADDGVVWDDLRPAIQTLKPELLALLQSDPLTPGEVPPADGLQRRGAFIMPTRETLPAYAAHFEAKADGRSTPQSDSDRQAERIRRMAAEITPDELLSARKRIKPVLQKSLRETELLELALTLAHADKREESLTQGANRPARVFYPRDVYQPEKQAKETNYENTKHRKAD